MIIAVILGILAFIGAFVYFVSGVSGTAAPIKKYQCSVNVDQFIKGLRKYTADHPDMTFNVTDTVGSQANGYAYYSDITMIKDGLHLEYSLEFENEVGMTSKVELVSALDLTNLSGGYRSGAHGIVVLVSYFDSNFLLGFQKSQNIQLSPIKPTFLDPLKHWWTGD